MKKSGSAGSTNGAALVEAFKANGYGPPRPGEPLVDPDRYPLLFALRPRTVSMLRSSLRKVPEAKRPKDPRTGEPFTSDEIIRRVGYQYPSIVLSVTAIADARQPHPDAPPKTRAFIEKKLWAILERLEHAERDPGASPLRCENSALTRELGAASFEVRETLRWIRQTDQAPLAEYLTAAFYSASFQQQLGLPIATGVRVCWHAALARHGRDIAHAEASDQKDFKAWRAACMRILREKTG